MKEYIGILFGVCMLAALVRVVAPEGVMKKYIEMVCALCVISAIILPLTQLLSDIQSIDISIENGEAEMSNYDEIYNSYLAKGSLGDAEKILEREIADAFIKGSGEVDIDIRANVQGDNVQVSGINVTLIGSAVTADPEQVRQYVLGRTGVECEILYDIIVEKEKI